MKLKFMIILIHNVDGLIAPGDTLCDVRNLWDRISDISVELMRSKGLTLMAAI